MRTKMFSALLAGAVLLPFTVSAASDAPKRLQSAAQAFKEVMGIPDKSIPQDLLSKAECIVIVPDLKKGAFIVGGKYGKGFLSCRKKGGVGWSAPGAIRIEGGSVGFQIGGSEMDVFMLVMNEKGVDRLLSSKFTLGGDATVAAGPVGRVAQAETDARMTAEILTWSRARGPFRRHRSQRRYLARRRGLERRTLREALKNREIVEGSVAPPKAAAPLLMELDRYSSRK